MLACEARAYLLTFASASEQTKYAAASTAGGRRSDEATTSTGMGDRELRHCRGDTAHRQRRGMDTARELPELLLCLFELALELGIDVGNELLNVS